MRASELGQASLALALVRLPMASRMVSQAPAFDAGVLDIPFLLHSILYKPRQYQIGNPSQSPHRPIAHFESERIHSMNISSPQWRRLVDVELKQVYYKNS
jgi:hypothetical protein